jgi:hypothetical protein
MQRAAAVRSVVVNLLYYMRDTYDMNVGMAKNVILVSYTPTRLLAELEGMFDFPYPETVDEIRAMFEAIPVSIDASHITDEDAEFMLVDDFIKSHHTWLRENTTKH